MFREPRSHCGHIPYDLDHTRCGQHGSSPENPVSLFTGVNRYFITSLNCRWSVALATFLLDLRFPAASSPPGQASPGRSIPAYLFFLSATLARTLAFFGKNFFYIQSWYN